MDILGVKAMTEQPYKRQLDTLRKFDSTMRDVLAAGKRTDFKTSTFSDSIVIVLPLPRGEQARRRALQSILVRCADLQLSLASNGFFLRGGLTIGRYFYTDEMVYGKGLVDAWRLEDTKAVTPRIVIDQDCEELRQIVNDPGSSGLRREWLARDHDGSVFLDYLASAQAFSQLSGTGQSLLATHKSVVEESLTQNRANATTWEKFRWVAEYHNAAVTTLMNPEEADDLLIAATKGIARRFESVDSIGADPPTSSA